MTVLLDAQLPQSLVRPLERLGCDVLHSLDLPEGNCSGDDMISSIADRDGRVVFSKDISSAVISCAALVPGF
jgi:predicted nuclease of predicted toxin-antitoxin system